MLDGKYCTIINKITKNVIAAGKIINHKDNPISCITFDNKHFFNLNCNLLYKFIFSEYTDTINLDIKKYKNKIYLWREVFVKPHKLIYREYDINELDEEIKDLVLQLNRLGIKTVGSCCGHGKYNAWVDIKFSNFFQIKKILNLIDMKKFNNKFCLTSDSTLVNNGEKKEIFLRLKTTGIGNSAYNDINELVNVMKIIPEFR